MEPFGAVYIPSGNSAQACVLKRRGVSREGDGLHRLRKNP